MRSARHAVSLNEATQGCDDGNELRWLDRFSKVKRVARVEHSTTILRPSVCGECRCWDIPAAFLP
jgi:hypothetical protein